MICILKDCSHNQEEQPEQNFSLNQYEETGYSKICKDCESIVNKKNNLLKDTKIHFKRDLQLKHLQDNVIRVEGKKYDVTKLDDIDQASCVSLLLRLRKTKRLLKNRMQNV